MSNPTCLILVCCHAIYLSGPTRGRSEDEWLLAPFQKDETPTFIQHAKTGLQLLSTMPSSHLVFSGSKTRKETEKSEAQSYLDLCVDNNFWDLLSVYDLKREDFERRIVLEEQSLDSFGNLMFSFIQFWKKTGTWPQRIIIVGHEFKRDRFMKLHVPALRYTVRKVKYIGIDPEYMDKGHPTYDEERAKEVRKGEDQRGFNEWEKDLLGVGESLKRKKRSRNCWGVSQAWFVSEVQRARSGVQSRCLDDGEEVLCDDRRYPWE